MYVGKSYLDSLRQVFLFLFSLLIFWHEGSEVKRWIL